MMHAVAMPGRSCLRWCWIALIWPVMFVTALGDPGNPRSLGWRTSAQPESEENPLKSSEDEAESLPATTHRHQRMTRKAALLLRGSERRFERINVARTAGAAVARHGPTKISHFNAAGVRCPLLC